MKKVFDEAFAFIKAHLADFVEGLIVVLTGGVALIPVLIYRYWNQIESFTMGMISTVVNFFTQLPNRILAV